MSLSICMKGYYEDFCNFGRRKNKANLKPNKANLNFTAENAECAEQKGIHINDCPIKKYNLHLTSPRSLRTLRLMRNKANLSFTAEIAECAEVFNV